jgi:transcriptional regulator with XRE-family HTH domain
MRHRDFYRLVGETLRTLRLRAGLTQEKVALIANLDRTTVGRWERAERGIGMSHLRRVLIAVGSNWLEFGNEMAKRDPGGPHFHNSPYNRYYVNYLPMWIVEKATGPTSSTPYWPDTGGRPAANGSLFVAPMNPSSSA